MTDSHRRVDAPHNRSSSRSAAGESPSPPDQDRLAAGGTDAQPWPAHLAGITESVVATLGPNERWNVAALGLVAGTPVTAKTWGCTRTRRNFDRTGAGVVQFVTDPVVFVDAALSVVERDEPVLDSAAAWARVSVRSIETGETDGTSWERWALVPVETTVCETPVPTIDRGFAAVVEGTVHASRLNVANYDESRLRRRLADCANVVDRTGSPREREAFERLCEHVDEPLSDWRDQP